MDERPPIPAKPPSPLRRFLTLSSWGPGTSWFVLLLCLLGTYVVWEVTRGQAEERVAEQFRTRVERISQNITNRMLAYDQVLKGAEGLFRASISVERGEWREYVGAVGIEDHYPGIRGLGFIKYVTPATLAAFLATNRNDFPTDYPVKQFDITPPPGDRVDYLVVSYVEPINKNSNSLALLVDLGTNTVRRSAAEAARDSGKATLTGRLTLLQGTNTDAGVMLLRPIYSNNFPHATLDQRRATLDGWVFGAFLMADLMTNILHDSRSDVDFEIFDGSDLSTNSLLYDDDGVFHAGDGELPGVRRTKSSLTITSRDWTVYFRTLPGFARREQWNKPRFMALAGLCMSLLFFGIARAVTSTQARAERLAAEITRTLRVQERAISSSTNGITILDATQPELTVIYANPAVERMTGYSADEIKAQNTSVIVGPELDQPGVTELRDAIQEGRAARAELRCHRKDGSFYWNEVSLAPLRDRYNSVTHFVAISTDITEAKRSEEALRSVSNRLTLATRAASLGVWDWDIVANKLVWDEAMYRIYGVSPDQFSGAYAAWESCVHPDDKQRATDELQQALRGERDFHTEFRVVLPDKSVRHLTANGVVLRDAAGRAIQMLGINADVTERRRAQRELEQARFAAEAASRAKSEFVANMSHEIRTPLNAVLGMTDLALDTPLNAEQRGYLDTARQSAAQLLAVVNDVLDFSRIEAGKIELNPEPFLLRQALQLWLAPFSFRAREKGLRLDFHVHPDVPDALIGDVLRLRQILVNLVGNALKFTEYGEVIIQVNPAPEGSRQDHAEPAPLVPLQFTVADTGIGIPADKQEAIFEAFTQGDSSITRIHGGTGLGLAISRRLVSLMGGRLWVESDPGRGSRFCFTVTMPAAPPDAAMAPAVRAGAPVPASPISSRSLRVLVTEDNPVNAELLTTLLRKFGHATHVATSGHEALAALERDRFDLVLMDLQMPGLDGIKTTASIRQNERGTGRHTPIIAVTAHALQGTRELCLAAGMDDYLAKPIDRHDLFAAIERAVAGAAPERLVPSPALPVDHILQQVSGDAPAARKLISLFLETTPPLLAELRAALEAGDSDRLRRATHTLKGSVTQLGDAPAREAALRLESLAQGARLEAAGPILAQLEARLARLTGELRELLLTLPAA